MNSAQVVAGKAETRSEGEASADAMTEQPRILDLLLRIPVSNTDWEPSREAAAECGCERGRVCPFRALCLD
jgi:hypothetical protein